MDHHRIVEDIRSFLQGSDQTLTDSLRELASDYANACKEANQRLRRCEEFLQKGLNSEAVHLAQAEPPLLDVVAALDFPEQAQWSEITATYGLPSAPQLSLATAEALNEAYTTLQPLEHLLRRHRRLALSRAPVTARLAVLREISGIDVANSVWSDDIADLEKVRIRQLEAETKQALLSSDTRAVTALLEEVNLTPWQVPLPVQIVEQIEHAARHKEMQQTRQALLALEMDLHTAVAARDLAKARELRERWKSETARAQLAADDPLHDRVAGSLDWIAGQERRLAEQRKQRAALLALESALGQQTQRPQLEELYRAVLVHDGAIPEDIETRYRARLDALESAVRQRRKVLLLGTAIAGVFLVLGAAMWTYQGIRDRQIAEAVAAANRLRDSGALAEALSYLDQLVVTSPSIAEAPPLMRLRKLISGEQETERQRVAFFEETLKQARMAPLDALNAPALVNVQALARLPDEKLCVQRLLSERGERAHQALAEREQGFQKAVRRLDDEVHDMEARAAADPSDPKLVQRVADAQAELGRLASAFAQTTGPLQELCRDISVRLDQVRQAVAAGESERSFIAYITAGMVGKPDCAEFVKRLDTYVAKYPSSPRGHSFQEALKERGLWEAATEWTQLAARDPLAVPPVEALARAAQVRQVIALHPDFVEADLARKYLLYLEALGEQDESNPKSAAAELREIFSHFLIKNLWCATIEGKNYYLASDPTPRFQAAARDKKPLVNVRHLSSMDGSEKLRNLQFEKVEHYGRSPQSTVADMVLKMPRDFADKTWDQALLRIAAAIQSSSDMDPILKLKLFRQVLEIASRGSVPLAQALENHRRTVSQANLDLSKTPWVDPDAQDNAPIRTAAMAVLAKVPSLKPVREAALEHRNKLLATIQESTSEIAGWLAWDKVSGWQCLGSLKTDSTVRTYVVIKGNNPQARWQQVGTLQDGKLLIDPKLSASLREGQPLFILKKSDQNRAW